VTVPIRDICHWFIKKAHEKNEPMTHITLQKLLYFTWVWYRVSFDKSLFDYKFNTFEYGPVHEDVWQTYKNYKGGAFLPLPSKESCLTSDITQFLEEIWTEYGTSGTFELSDLSHEDPVWETEFNKDQKLPFVEKEKMILNYYGNIKKRCDEEKDEFLLDKISKFKYPEDYIGIEESQNLINRLCGLSV
jgi:uncharacterized phage-associated protein